MAQQHQDLCKIVGLTLLLTTAAAPADELSQPGDFILMLPFIGSSTAGGEDVTKAIDFNNATKYANNAGAGSGYLTLPSGGKSIATGLLIVSGNDNPGRDPSSYTVEGSDDALSFTLIASNSVPPFTARFQEVDLSFANTQAFKFYRLLFPTVVGAPLMQVSEARLQGTFTGDTTPPPVEILQQPADVTVPILTTAIFSVVANQGAVTYQWNYNGQEISGAVLSTYQTTVSAADSGALFDVVVTSLIDSTSVTSRQATLTVVGGGNPLFVPTDYVLGIPLNSTVAYGEGPWNTIDGDINTKLFNGLKNNTGIQVWPAGGSSVASALSLSSGNDNPGRDPSTFLVLGSTNGIDFTLIASNSVPIFAGRHAGQLLPFTNTQACQFYRVIFPTVVDEAGADGMQIAEIQLLGDFTGDTALPAPMLLQDLTDAVVVDSVPVTFQVIATLPNLTYTWYQDNAVIPGAANTTYDVDATDGNSTFFVVAENASGSVTSRVAHVTVISGTNVIQASDYSVQLPVGSGSYPGEGLTNAFDNNTATKYFNSAKANAGFFVQPGGMQSVVGSLMVASANDQPVRDPSSFLLEGSNDGTHYVTIASNSVPPFTARFQTWYTSFSNSAAFYFYRLTFPTIVDAAAAAGTQVSEVNLFGEFNDQASPPLAFVSEPEDTAVALNTSFSLYGYASLPASYQWWENGTLLSSAPPDPVYTAVATLDLNGAAFHVVANAGGGQITSRDARVTILPVNAGLSIALVNGAPVLTWSVPGTLQSTTSLDSPDSWADVTPAATSPYQPPQPSAGPVRYYRLRF